MPYDVFISYATEDKPFADKICEVLEVNGIRCWIAPRDIKPARDYSEEILSAIEASSAFLLVLSAHSNESPHVKREVERAVNKNAHIIPVRIEEVAPSKSLEYFISTSQWIDAFLPPLESHIRRLADGLREDIPTRPAAAYVARAPSASAHRPTELMNLPLCFVLMPFGKKTNLAGGIVDFDAVYQDLIAPAIEAAGLQPLRADEEMTGGIIHKPMFERLVLCEYAVADLTIANANVFYELGVRHAVRRHSTVLIFAACCSQLPFDVAPLRALPYKLTPEGTPTEVAAAREALTGRLQEAKKKGSTDSPLFQLLEDYPDIDHTKTDVFRDRVQYSAKFKTRLAQARQAGKEALRALEQELGQIEDEEAGVVIDLFLSYRAVQAWPEMIALVQKMTPPLAATVMVQEQLALALNRDNQGEEAERVLLELLAKRGPSSETYGILGRVYKDCWEAAVKSGQGFLAQGLLDKAVAAYRRGFEADWRDAYPGVNAVTLMELQEPPDPKRLELLPVVAYAVERRLAAGKPDYWDYATRLELAILAQDEQKALAALGDALAAVRESWEPGTTARNLRLIREARARRQEEVPWARQIEAELERRSL